MKLLPTILALAVLGPATVFAKIGDRCKAPLAGSCQKESWCKSKGGYTIANHCPNDPKDVKCCLKTVCYGSRSMCNWPDQCRGVGQHISGTRVFSAGDTMR